eukprot:g14981.t1
MGGKNGGGKNASGKGGSNKGKGKKQQLEGRLRKVETMTARLKSWSTFSCKGFGCKPCHVWKKQKLIEYANQGADDSEDRDEAQLLQPGEASRASGSKDANSSGYEGVSDKALQRKMNKFSPSPRTKSKSGDAADEAAAKSQIIDSTQYDIEPTNLDMKLVEEQHGDVVTPAFWKADVMTTIIDKLVEQKVMEGDEKHVLRLSKLENGRQTKERVESGKKVTRGEAKKCGELVANVVKYLDKIRDNPGRIDWIAVYEKTELMDITLKPGATAGEIMDIVDSQRDNASEIFAFEAFLKPNTPPTPAAAADVEKKIIKTAKKDAEKANRLGLNDEDLDMGEADGDERGGEDDDEDMEVNAGGAAAGGRGGGKHSMKMAVIKPGGTAMKRGAAAAGAKDNAANKKLKAESGAAAAKGGAKGAGKGATSSKY